MGIKENKNYYDAGMHQINGDSLCLSTYQYLKKNSEWAGRYEDSQFLGVMIIMDMVVIMVDGNIANIEIQKISYDFPAVTIDIKLYRLED